MMPFLLVLAAGALQAPDATDDVRGRAYDAAWRYGGKAALNDELDALRPHEAAAQASPRIASAEKAFSTDNGHDQLLKVALAEDPSFEPALKAAYKQKEQDAKAGRADNVDRILAAGHNEIEDLVAHAKSDVAAALQPLQASSFAETGTNQAGSRRKAEDLSEQVSALQQESKAEVGRGKQTLQQAEAKLAAVHEVMALLKAHPHDSLAALKKQFNALQAKIAEDKAKDKALTSPRPEKPFLPNAPGASSLAQMRLTPESDMEEEMERSFEKGLSKGFRRVHDRASKHVEREEAVQEAAEAKSSNELLEADSERRAVADLMRNSEAPADEALQKQYAMDKDAKEDSNLRLDS